MTDLNNAEYVLTTTLMAGSQNVENLARGMDSYDLSTNVFEDVVVLADGDFVVRQHTQRSKTLRGRAGSCENSARLFAY